jgi:hypothetical protein
MTRFQRFFNGALCVAAFCSSSVIAQQDQGEALKIYDVEIVIFKNVKVPRSHEINLPVAAPGATDNSLQLGQILNATKAAVKAGFSTLGDDELQLLPQVQQIDESGRYDLLLHTAWRQPGLEEAQSIPVVIRTGKVYPSSYSSIDQFRDLENASTVDAAAAKPTEENPDSLSSDSMSRRGLHELEGLITISLSRYLHTNVQLVLRKPASNIELLEQTASDDTLADLEGGILLNHLLDEKRRMRSRKLHYLDHPQFGMLVLITPYEEKEAESVSDEENGETAEAVAAPEASG